MLKILTLSKEISVLDINKQQLLYSTQSCSKEFVDHYIYSVKTQLKNLDAVEKQLKTLL